jgi:hypothetical protein
MRSDDVMGREQAVEFYWLDVFECELIDPKIDRAFFTLGSWGGLVLCVLTM